VKRLLTAAALFVIGAMVAAAVLVFWLAEWMDPAPQEVGE
jgi:hypothetical protein